MLSCLCIGTRPGIHFVEIGVEESVEPSCPEAKRDVPLPSTLDQSTHQSIGRYTRPHARTQRHTQHHNNASQSKQRLPSPSSSAPPAVVVSIVARPITARRYPRPHAPPLTPPIWLSPATLERGHLALDQWNRSFGCCVSGLLMPVYKWLVVGGVNNKKKKKSTYLQSTPSGRLQPGVVLFSFRSMPRISGQLGQSVLHPAWKKYTHTHTHTQKAKTLLPRPPRLHR